MQIIKIDITPAQIATAQQLYDFYNLNNSILRGEGQIYGAIGEVLVGDYFRSQALEVQRDSTGDYDLTIGGYKIEVKTKAVKRLNLNIDATVAESNHSQKCEYYFFTQVLYDLSKGYLLGYKAPRDFYNEATHYLKGDRDGKFTFRANCYNLKIENLIGFKVKTLSL